MDRFCASIQLFIIKRLCKHILVDVYIYNLATTAAFWIKEFFIYKRWKWARAMPFNDSCVCLYNKSLTVSMCSLINWLSIHTADKHKVLYWCASMAVCKQRESLLLHIQNVDGRGCKVRSFIKFVCRNGRGWWVELLTRQHAIRFVDKVPAFKTTHTAQGIQ